MLGVLVVDFSSTGVLTLFVFSLRLEFIGFVRDPLIEFMESQHT